ncbi:basic endochitinase [Arachis duranensis]|uniref:Acidic endochitinase n=1 Tax=Arachis duranensis TaxID=130453 RepID=A0A6P4DMR7_ARADU|nr:basic endochitinase [Arachis duranensis]
MVLDINYCHIMGSNEAPNISNSIILVLVALVSVTNGGDIVVYWGQDGREGSLSATCNSGLYKTVNIAFLSAFGGGTQPQLNLANHCNPASNGCLSLNKDIKNCQARGIQVLLSIGGGAPGYSLSSSKDATNLANYIWNNFLGGKSNSRPFGNVVLDGVDFDIELGGGASFYIVLAKTFSNLSKGGQKVYLSAAPQCPFPDKQLNGALSTGLFDYVWIQFYNNGPCEFDANNPRKFQRSWNQWTSSIRAGKLYVGFPASPSQSAAGSGYVPPQVLMNRVLPFVKKSSIYGGVMLWDRFNDLQTGYSRNIKPSV